MKSFAEPRMRTLVLGALALSLGVLGPVMPGLAQDPPDQTAVAKGEAALAEARQYASEGRWDQAANKYAEALGHLPDNQEAQEGLNRARTMLDQGATSADVAAERERLRQQTLAEFDDSMDRAEELLRQGSYDTAQQEIALARARIDERQTIIGDVMHTELSERARAISDRIASERTAAELRSAQEAREAAEQAKLEQERRDRETREAQIKERLRRVNQLQRELKLHEAMQVVDEILFLDPNNEAAMGLRWSLQNNIQYMDYAELQRIKERNFGQLSVDSQNSMIAPVRNISGPGDRSINGVLNYPEDWPQISNMRGGASGYIETPADRALRQKLAETVVPVDFTNNSFDQVVAFMENVTGLDIYVDYKALNNVGIDKEDTIDLRLANANMKTTLERVLEQLGEDEERPQYTIQDGILTITSEEALRLRTVLLVYDIRDLLFQVPTFDNAPSLDLDTALDQGSGQGSGGGGGGGRGGGGGGGGSGSGSGGSIFDTPGEDPERPSREELVEQIVNIIQDNIDPDGWRDLGGDTGSLQELNGNLIITNTPNNHQAIEGLLSQLREIRALQINVESRFMTVANDWFEKIGVDLDLYFNTNNDMFQAARNVDPNFHLSDFFNGDGSLKDPVIFGGPGDIPDPGTAGPGDPNTIPTGALIGVPNAAGTGIDYLIGPVGSPIRNQQGFGPVGVTQNHNNLVDQIADFSAATTAGIATANPALAVGIQFLDDVQVDLLIEATQADKRSVVLTAPRLTFFNGQRSWIAVTTQQAFISALTAVTGDAAGAFQPTVDTLQDGFVLDVEGVISSDRRYVTMTVLFDFAEFLGFRESSAAEFGGAAGGGGTVGGGGDAASFTGRVELPILRVSQVRTTVSVPDKGTVLLGGQRRVTEVEVETGVPVLSKLPIINRFFTNRVTSKEEQTLLILIRPEIIIQQENEDILFPGLSDSVGSAAYVR